MVRRMGFALIAFLVAIAALPVSARANCLSDDEYRAFSVRHLQTELMVAALSCQGGDHVERYNSFVGRFATPLAGHGRTLKRVFRRYYGLQAPGLLNAYITELANWASVSSLAQPNFCDRSAGLFTAVLDLKNSELARFSAARGQVDVGIPACSEAAAPDALG